MTNPASFRPLSAAEIAQIADKYSDAGVASGMIHETRALYPDATGIGYDWSNEYDDEGGTYPSTNAVYVLFADNKYHRIAWDEVLDQDDEEIEVLPGDHNPESLFDALSFGINRVRDLTEAKSGPGELNFDFAALEKGYLTELPALYVEVAQ